MIALRLALLAAATALPVVAAAQEMDPSMPMPGMGGASRGQAASKQPATSTRAQVSQRAGPATGRKASSAARRPRAGGPKQAQPASAGPQAGNDMAGSMGSARGEMPNPQPPPAALSGPAHAADMIYGTSNMAKAREDLRVGEGDARAYRVLVDRLETSFQKGGGAYRWDAQGWYGSDINKLWIKTEGRGPYRGKLEQAEVQALWSRAVTPWFDLQMGVRQDFAPSSRRTHAVLGLQGLMPYAYNVEAALFLSNKGELTGRINADYDLLITQRLILQPRAEMDFAAQNIRDLGIGAGVSTVELGLRLRYEFIPEFAPYVGVEYEQKVGKTASFARAAGQDSGSLRYLVGLRSWF
jgi:copper resistance protein B